MNWVVRLRGDSHNEHTVTYPHIELTPDGVAVLSGTKTKVIEIVLDRLAYHWDADEIRRQHPHLSLGQIHAALVDDAAVFR